MLPVDHRRGRHADDGGRSDRTLTLLRVKHSLRDQSGHEKAGQYLQRGLHVARAEGQLFGAHFRPFVTTLTAAI